MKLSKRISCFLALVVILSALTVIQAMNTEVAGKDLSLAEMGRVIGGAACEACLDMCTSDSCPDSRCEGSDDKGELCGIATNATGSAYTCQPWGDANDNCTKTGKDKSCKTKVCKCDNSSGTDCQSQSAYTNHTGPELCSD